MKKRIFKSLSFMHRWLGFSLSVLFLITLVSGLYTGTVRLLDRYQPDFGQVLPVLTLEETADTLGQLAQRFPNATSLTPPTASQPYYIASSRQMTLYLSAPDLSVLHRAQRQSSPLRSYMLMLHRNFARGQDARWMVAWTSLGAVALTVVGVIAWWPLRRSFRRKDLMPRSLKRSVVFRSHMSIGIIVSAVILGMGLSGAAMTYTTQARAVLSATAPAATITYRSPEYPFEPGWANAVAFGSALFEGAPLMQISKPRRAPVGSFGQVYELRYAAPGDWAATGNSYVLVDSVTWGVLGVNRFAEKPFGQKLSEMMRALHEGRNMSNGYLIGLLLANLAIVMMVLMGLFSFMQKSYRASVRRAPNRITRRVSNLFQKGPSQ